MRKWLSITAALVLAACGSGPKLGAGSPTPFPQYINQAPPAVVANGTELVPCVVGSQTKQCTTQEIADLAASSTGVTTFDGRRGAVTLQSGDVTPLLGQAAQKAVSDLSKSAVASVAGPVGSGNCAQFSDVSGTVGDAGQPCGSGTLTEAGITAAAHQVPLSPFQFGAICDGGSHPLSTRYGSLAAAQAVYPFITSLSQQIDYAALKAMSNAALGPDGSENGVSGPQLNKAIFLPGGICEFGNDTWKVSKVKGALLAGVSMMSTIIEGNGTVFQTDGFWYSTISNIQFRTLATSATPTVDIDGNVAGAGSTFGVQGSTFINVMVQGNYNVDEVFSFCRRGVSAQCSENILINPHLFGSNFASYYQNGFNALDNVIQGGDIQGFKKNGVFLVGGSLKIFGTSFESTWGYNQLLNPVGCDVNASSTGAGDSIGLYGSRSEDLSIYCGAASQLADIHGIAQLPALPAWSGTTSFSLNDATLQTGTDSKKHLFVVTTAGTSGGSTPTWPATGTVTDGSVVWTKTNYTAVTLSGGWLDYATSFIDPSATVSWAIGSQPFGIGNATKFNCSTCYGFGVDGGNDVVESYVQAQNAIMSMYCNPQGTPQALNSAVTIPGDGGISNICGAATAAGTALIFAPGKYLEFRPTTFTQFTGHLTGDALGAPALTSCGGGSPAIVGDDKDFQITEGTTATGCVATFHAAYVAAPLCTVSPQSVNPAALTYAISNTALTISNSSLSGLVLNVHCTARNGG